MKKRIVIDTDFGTDVDDALALALALASPEIEIVSILTVARKILVEGYLKLANAENIPVYHGENPNRMNWFGNEGVGIFSHQSNKSAVDAILELYSASSDVIYLGIQHNHPSLTIAIGTLTNLATALQKNPDVGKNIPQLIIMGGHLNNIIIEGNQLPWGLDYNLCADSLAADIVFKSRIEKVRLVTADVTMQTYMTKQDLKRFEKSNNPFMKALTKDIDAWSTVQHSILPSVPSNECYLHDPLTLATLLRDDFCKFETLHIQGIITSEIFAGSNIFRTIPYPNAIPGTTREVECAVKVQAHDFQTFMVERLMSHFV